jgi:nickel-dependent lactate racemase
MKTFEYKFAKDKVKFSIDEKNILDVLQPNEYVPELTGAAEVKRSLETPINSKRLKDIVKKGEKVAIVTSDITRPMPSSVVLPPVVEELKKAGAEEQDITVYLALGSHRAHTAEEKEYLVGSDVYNSDINIVDSDVNNCVNFGQCKNGTPIDIFKPVAEADRVICLGNIEYHYFAGYSGGAKAIMPGVSSWEAIQANHSNMVKPASRAGNLDTNPVRQDIDEVGEHFKIDFIVNVVLNKKKEVVKSVAGHYLDAHREGCKILDSIYGVKIEKKADIVITTPGGFPKDLNLYQSQKALDNSKHAVNDGGIIILVASAKERFGEETFEEWMLNKTPDEMIDLIKKDFKLGGHKAAAIAGVLKNNDIYFVSDLDDALVKKINFVPFDTVQDAIDQALKVKGQAADIILMPYAGSTLPLI